jgi:UPF0271 protein
MSRDDIEALGDRAVRIPRPAGAAPRALVREIRGWPGVTDVVVAKDTIGVYFACAPALDDARIAALATLLDLAEPPREHDLRAIYDGEDLAALGPDAAELHASATYTVEMMGFLPGFAYLAGLPERLAAIPRRATPRTRVPGNAIGVAGGYTGIYPFDSAGGWHLIGRVVGVSMFGEGGSLLAIGDRVRFVPA